MHRQQQQQQQQQLTYTLPLCSICVCSEHQLYFSSCTIHSSFSVILARVQPLQNNAKCAALPFPLFARVHSTTSGVWSTLAVPAAAAAAAPTNSSSTSSGNMTPFLAMLTMGGVGKLLANTSTLLAKVTA
jgi:hypothetical protein